MEAQAIGSSVRSPALTTTTPFTPASPLPSMDVLMQDPGMLYSSPGQEASAPNEETPPVKKALPREVTLEKLERAEAVISQVRKGAEDLIAALRETAVMRGAPAVVPGSTADGRKRGLESGEEGTSVKRARIGNAKTAEKDDEGSPADDEITPVSVVISRVEAALAELAGIGKELTEAGVSFLPGGVNGHEAEPDADFAKREWDTLVARRKAEDDLENAQAALRKLHLQLRRRYEEDRETVWEVDRVMKGLDASEPDKVSKVLQRLRESGLFAEEENDGPRAGLSIKEQLERVHESVAAMELKLLGENGKDIWGRRSESESISLIESADDGQHVGDRPASLSCLLPGVLKATIGVSREGQLMTASISAATQAPGHRNETGHHRVFLDLTNIATSALFHFKSRRPRSALQSFLVWLYSYKNLFTQSCSACGKVLAHDPRSDTLLPPVMRPYKALLVNDLEEREAIHSFCHLQKFAYF